MILLENLVKIATTDELLTAKKMLESQKPNPASADGLFLSSIKIELEQRQLQTLDQNPFTQILKKITTSQLLDTKVRMQQIQNLSSSPQASLLLDTIELELYRRQTP